MFKIEIFAEGGVITTFTCPSGPWTLDVYGELLDYYERMGHPCYLVMTDKNGRLICEDAI